MNSNEKILNRVILIQYLIDKYDFSRYLEIGTQKGESFFPIVCKEKIAVDPFFQIKFKDKLKWYLRNSANLNNHFFQMTSDEFFEKEQPFLKKRGLIHISLIDGLHTFRATLKDCLNTLKYLSEKGLIILHDCYPPHKAASINAKDSDEALQKGLKMEGWTGEWCGDSWKAITYLRSKYKEDLEVFVLNADYGLGIVKPKSNNNLEFDIDEELYSKINKLQYEDLKKNSEMLIGLTPSKFYQEL